MDTPELRPSPETNTTSKPTGVIRVGADNNNATIHSISVVGRGQSHEPEGGSEAAVISRTHNRRGQQRSRGRQRMLPQGQTQPKPTEHTHMCLRSQAR